VGLSDQSTRNHPTQVRQSYSKVGTENSGEKELQDWEPPHAGKAGLEAKRTVVKDSYSETRAMQTTPCR